jgi:hypothetical protein
MEGFLSFLDVGGTPLTSERSVPTQNTPDSHLRPCSHCDWHRNSLEKIISNNEYMYSVL